MSNLQDTLKDKYLHSGNLVFTIEESGFTRKLVATSTKPEDSYRGFAYFSDCFEKAKTAILMEYRLRRVQ